MSLDRPLPARRVRPTGVDPDDDTAPWYLTIPAVRQVLADGWDLDEVTVLVGENGAGKSTLVEASCAGGVVSSTTRRRRPT